MWRPAPPIFIPLYVGSESYRLVDLATILPWQSRPFQQPGLEYRARVERMEVTEKIFLKKACRDVAVGDDSFTINHEQGTQTLCMSTLEKSTITEVSMSDLDVHTEEFDKLKMVAEELQNLKDKKRSILVGARESSKELQMSESGDDAVQRARRAELHLLALQYFMCQQHFWRYYYTAPLGKSALQGTVILPDAMSKTLKRLANDFEENKRMILSGVPLENLKPLSVDFQGLISGTCYTPALTYEAYLEDLMLETPNGPQPVQTSKELEMETMFGALLGSPSTLPQEQAAISSEHQVKPKEVNSSEASFDAEEELGLTDEACEEKTQSGQHPRRESLTEQKGDATERNDQSYLCVTGLAGNMKECDLLLWFEKYHASEVCMSYNNRIAIVSVRSSEDAEAAVQDMNKQSIHGHTLHVERIHSSPACGQGLIKVSCPELSLMVHKVGPAVDETRTHGSEINPYTSKRLNLDKLIKVCETPTASGTCVPQHYATMGSFDILMTSLSKRHPNMSREKIVGAFLELRAKHQCFLSGLSLRVIEDMTSDFLTQLDIEVSGF